MMPWSTKDSFDRIWSCWCGGNTSITRLIVDTAVFV